MSDPPIALQLEISPEIAQQDIWVLEEQCKQVAGVTTDLQEPRDLVAATLLFIHIVGPYLEQGVTIAGGIKATHDLAQILYDFFHPAEKAETNALGKNKVVIVKKGVRIELYNLSSEEIARVIKTQ
jgi:hypothetical protein